MLDLFHTEAQKRSQTKPLMSREEVQWQLAGKTSDSAGCRDQRAAARPLISAQT